MLDRVIYAWWLAEVTPLKQHAQQPVRKQNATATRGTFSGRLSTYNLRHAQSIIVALKPRPTKTTLAHVCLPRWAQKDFLL